MVVFAMGATQIAMSSLAPHQDPRLGAVASENKICSQIGIDLLEQGGNAADAVSTDDRLWRISVLISA